MNDLSYQQATRLATGASYAIRPSRLAHTRFRGRSRSGARTCARSRLGEARHRSFPDVVRNDRRAKIRPRRRAAPLVRVRRVDPWHSTTCSPRIRLRDGVVGDRAQPMDQSDGCRNCARRRNSRPGGGREAAMRAAAQRDRARAWVHRRGRPSCTTTTSMSIRRTRVAAYERRDERAGREAAGGHRGEDLPRHRARWRPRRRPTRRTPTNSRRAPSSSRSGRSNRITRASRTTSSTRTTFPRSRRRRAAAARRYAAIAPSAAHALHMPSHTFTRVGQWNESIETNRRSIDVALRDSAIAEALHASDYAGVRVSATGAGFRGEGDARQASRARGAVRPTTRSPARLPGRRACSPSPRFRRATRSSGATGARPRRWSRRRARFRGRKRWCISPAPSARHIPANRRRAHGASIRWLRSAIDLAASESRIGRSRSRSSSSARGLARLRAASQRRRARRMRGAAAREDATEKSAVTPGPLAPARELLGDMLLELGRPREALVEYRATLAKEPNRFRALYGAMRAATAAGDRARRHSTRRVSKSSAPTPTCRAGRELAQIGE